MDLTKYQITIDPSSLPKVRDRDVYRRQVSEHLRWIYLTKAGKILLDCIRYHGKQIEIRPYAGAGCNASGGWTTVAGVRKGTVNYSPGTYSPHSGTCSVHRNEGGRGLIFDEVLFHELFHSFRGVSGKWHQVPLNGALFNYTDTEEFYAVLVTNIYIADKSNKIKSGLRASHQGHLPLGHPFTVPWGFFTRGTDVFGLIDKLYHDNYGLFIKLGNEVDAEFNPILDYLADKDKAKKASESAKSAIGVAKITLELLGMLK